ncbi:hypothetical protein [Bacillus alveayuensis]|jgi:uncharacterized membrane protein YgaE (UPF0421/DUF939 family)|uniref:hypothetical protein n=1 Tax=Aeribacillus alveayuensis TaxID=279215 RepID=UPI000A9A7C5B|nr:hypothetical protein [Bacillus alveayuensis]
MQTVFIMLGVAAAVFVIYYFPLIAKDLQKMVQQNEEIKNMLQHIADKLEKKD